MGREGENLPLARASRLAWSVRSAGSRAWRITRAVDCRSGTKRAAPLVFPAPIVATVGDSEYPVRIFTRQFARKCARQEGAVRASRSKGQLDDTRLANSAQP